MAQKCYILPICPEAPSGWICAKFGLGGPLADIINCAEFCCSRLMGFDSVEGRNSPSPIESAGATGQPVILKLFSPSGSIF